MPALGLVVDDIGRSQLVVEREVLGGLGRGDRKAVNQVTTPRLPRL